MTTQTSNKVFYWVLGIAAMLTEIPTPWLDAVPAKYKGAVVGLLMAAAWAKSHRNLFINPDGTPAWQSWKGGGPKL